MSLRSPRMNTTGLSPKSLDLSSIPLVYSAVSTGLTNDVLASAIYDVMFEVSGPPVRRAVLVRDQYIVWFWVLAPDPLFVFIMFLLFSVLYSRCYKEDYYHFGEFSLVSMFRFLCVHLEEGTQQTLLLDVLFKLVYTLRVMYIFFNFRERPTWRMVRRTFFCLFFGSTWLIAGLHLNKHPEDLRTMSWSELVPENGDEFDSKEDVRKKRERDRVDKVILPLTPKSFRELNGRYGRMRPGARDHLRLCWLYKRFNRQDYDEALLERLSLSPASMQARFEVRLFVVPEAGGFEDVSALFDSFYQTEGMCEMADLLRHLLFLIYVKDNKLLVVDRLLSIKQAYSRYDVATEGLWPELGLDDLKAFLKLKDAPMLSDFFTLLRRFMGSTYKTILPHSMTALFDDALENFSGDSIGSLSFSAVKFFLSLAESVIEVLKGVPISDVLGLSAAARWKSKVDALLSTTRLGQTESWPVKDTSQVMNFVRKLKALQQEGLSLQLSKSNPIIYDTYKSITTQLEALEQNLKPTRVVPAGYILCGEPGTGKTILANEFHYILQTYLGIDPSFSLMECYISSLNFQSWFNKDPKLILINDGFSTKEGYLEEESTALVLQRMIDSSALMVQEAAVEDKKFGLKRPRLVLVTTNVTTFSFPSQTHPDKLIRRLEVINMQWTPQAIAKAAAMNIPVAELMQECDPVTSDGLVDFTIHRMVLEGTHDLNFLGPIVKDENGAELTFRSRIGFMKFLKSRVTAKMDFLQKKYERELMAARCSHGIMLPHNTTICGCVSTPVPESGIADEIQRVMTFLPERSKFKNTLEMKALSACGSIAILYCFGLLALLFTFMMFLVYRVWFQYHEIIETPMPVRSLSFQERLSEWVYGSRFVLIGYGAYLLRNQYINRAFCFVFPRSERARSQRNVVLLVSGLTSFLILARLLKVVLSPEGGFLGTLRVDKDLPGGYVPSIGRPPPYFGGQDVLTKTDERYYGDNIVKLRRGSQFVYGLRITHNVVLLPHHFLSMKTSYPDHSSRTPCVVEGEAITVEYLENILVFEYSEKTMVRGEGDSCYLFVSGWCTPVVDIREQFLPQPPKTSVVTFMGYKVSAVLTNMMAFRTPLKVFTSVGVPTASGDCGELIVDGDKKILGFHIASNKWVNAQQAVALVITKGDVDKAIAYFHELGLATDPWIAANLVMENGDVLHPGLHPRSDAAHLAATGFKFSPIILGHRLNNSTTSFSGTVTDLHQHFGSKIPLYVLPEKVKAHRNSKDQWVGPFVNKCREMVSAPPGSINLGVGMRAVDLMLRRMPVVSTVTHPLTISQSIMGITGDQFARRRPQKSLGEACKRAGVTNDNLIEVISDTEGLLNPKYEQMVHKVLKDNIGAVGVSYNRFVVKEEWVEESKWIEKGKLRLFALLDSPVNIVMKAYLTPLMGFALSNSEWSGVCGLVNAGSCDWKRLHEHLGGHEISTVMESDQRAYDSHHRVMIDTYAYFIYKFAMSLGYTECEARMAQNMALSGFNQISDLEGNFYMYCYMLASGRSDTLFCNSIIHALIYLIAYILWHEERNLPVPEDYESVLAYAFVGDDTLAQCSLTGFDSLYVQRIATKLGYEITSARKDTPLEAVVPFSIATFLKRNFVVREGRVFAPLSVQSIYKALCYRLKSEASDSEYESSTVEGAQREFFLHGREALALFQTEMDATGRSYKKLDFDVMLQAFDEGLFTTWISSSATFVL